MKNTAIFEFLSNNDISVSIRYSRHTNKYYISADVELAHRGLLIGICEHEDTIDEALNAFNKATLNKPLVIKGIRCWLCLTQDNEIVLKKEVE